MQIDQLFRQHPQPVDVAASEALALDLAKHFVGGRIDPKSPLTTLSDRELQVFRLIGEGAVRAT